MRHWLFMYGLLSTCVGLLVGCESAKEEEIRTWMTEQRANAHPRITPLTEPKPFNPQDYTQQGAADPFSSDKLTQALKRDSSRVSANATLIAPELARRKEPLEAFPLDTISMVGSLVKTGQPVALVNIGALLYQVRRGEHLGQNFGRITSITETEIALHEIVQDAAGDWTERMTSLQLREGSK